MKFQGSTGFIIVLVLSLSLNVVNAETIAPQQVQIKLQEIQIMNKPINNGTIIFTIICNDQEDVNIVKLGKVAIGENITASSPLLEVKSGEFSWKVMLVDGSEQLMWLNGWSDFQNTQYENPLFINETRLSLPQKGNSLVIYVTKVAGVVQFAAELQSTEYKNFVLQYWIDANGDLKPQAPEVILKNLTAVNGTILMDDSSFTSLRLVTNFEVQLNMTNRNVAWFSGTWDFRSNKPLFSNSSLSPDLDVIKWGWFYPDPKSTVVDIPLDNEELFHKLKTGITSRSVSHGSGVLVGKPTELLNKVLDMLQGKQSSAAPPVTPPTPQQPSPTSLEQLIPLGILILTPAAIILSIVAGIKTRNYLRRRRQLKTGGFQL